MKKEYFIGLPIVVATAMFIFRGKLKSTLSATMNTLQKREAATAAQSDRLAKLRSALKKDGGKPRLNVVVEDPNEHEELLSPEIEEAHRVAFEKGEAMYTDPNSGLMVFTRQAHIDRGRCCGSHCRHCPYGHVCVPTARREKWAEKNKSHKTKVTPDANASMKVYTRTGDGGQSSLFTGERRAKCDPIFEALGTVDELNSALGLAIAQMKVSGLTEDDVLGKERKRVVETLGVVQDRLLLVGSVVATPPASAEDAARPSGNATIDSALPADWAKELEAGIDSMDKLLPTLTAFIRPGGTVAAAQLHVARSTCRRAERRMIELKEQQAFYRAQFPDALKFINRLSDYLFTAGRLYDVAE